MGAGRAGSVEVEGDIVLMIADSFGIEIIQQETGRDHIHILFASSPQIQVESVHSFVQMDSPKMVML